METFLRLGLLVSCLTGVTSQISLVESGPGVVKPAETLTLTCKVTGASLTDSTNMFSVEWVRQPTGRGLEWLARIIYNADTYYAQSVQGRVTVTRDTNKGEVYFKLTGVKPEDTATYYCARPLYFDYWGQGTLVTVTTAEKSAPSLFPLLSCGKSLGQDPITIGCLAKDFIPDSISFSWTDKSNSSYTNGFKKYPSVLQSGTYTASSQVNVPSASWEKRDPFYCVAKHADNNKAVELINKGVTIEIKSPVISINPPMKDNIHNGSVTIVCLLSGFYPKAITVKWLKNGLEVKTDTKTEVPAADSNGYFDTTSYIVTSKKDWDADTIYSCLVDHPSSHFYEMRNVSKSQVCEPQGGSVDIGVITIPSSFQEIYETQSVKLTCLVTNMVSTDGLSITWYKIGEAKPLKTKLEDPIYNDNSTYSTVGTTTVCADDWQKEKFKCKVTHRELASPKEVSLSKESGEDGVPPSVYVFPPPLEELSQRETVTLTCLVKGFNPGDAFVKWLHRDEELPEHMYINTNSIKEKTTNGRNLFFIYSKLTLASPDRWNAGDTFSCVVGHETLPLKLTQRSIDKFTVRVLYVDEDEDIDNLWTTASTFIVLFLLSLFYSATVTLFKVK